MRTRTIASLLICAVLAACAASPGRIRQTGPVAALEALDGLAIEGYDAVAYFEEGAPRKGSRAYAYRWQGAEWRFATPAHRDAFAAEPERYAPRYGNYCAFAVSRGTTAHGDPRLWSIVDERLYLNNNRFAQELWNQEREANIIAGDINWPLLPKQDGRPSD